jgi:type I restriction enzyme S subunit
VSEGPWPIVSLGELIASIEAGASFRCRETPPEADEVGVAKVSAVSWGHYDENESKTCLNASRIDPSLLIQKGDFLVSRANTVQLVGACVIAERVTKQVMLSDKTLRIQFTDQSLKPWVLQYLKSREGRSQIEALCTGNQESMRNISQKSIRQIQLPLAPAEERDRVIAYLDQQLSRLQASVEIFGIIQAKLKQARASILKAAVEGRLGMHENAIPGSPAASNHINKWQQEINEIKDKNRTSNRSARKKQNKDLQSCADEKGWIQATVSEIANVQLGRQRSPKDHNGPWMMPYLRAANITWDGFALVDVNSMNFDPSERERFALKVGDILLNEASGSASEVGKPAIWRGEIPDCCFQNTLLRVRTILSLQRWILLHFLADAKSGRFSRSSKGVGIHHLSANTLSAHIIRIPPPEQQERIVAEVDRRFSVLDQVEATVAASLTRCGKLRQAILKRAFEGQLVPAA